MTVAKAESEDSTKALGTPKEELYRTHMKLDSGIEGESLNIRRIRPWMKVQVMSSSCDCKVKLLSR